MHQSISLGASTSSVHTGIFVPLLVHENQLPIPPFIKLQHKIVLYISVLNTKFTVCSSDLHLTTSMIVTKTSNSCYRISYNYLYEIIPFSHLLLSILFFLNPTAADYEEDRSRSDNKTWKVSLPYKTHQLEHKKKRREILKLKLRNFSVFFFFF